VTFINIIIIIIITSSSSLLQVDKPQPVQKWLIEKNRNR